MSASSERFPLRAGSLIWRQISRSVLPSHPISCGARCQFGLPGMPAGSKLACRWQMGQRIAGRPNPSAPRSTGGWWSRAMSPWRGRSPAGWQFRQRGCVSTLPSSVNIAAERAAVSPIDEKLSTLARSCGGASETACAASMLADKIAIETKSGRRKSNGIIGCFLGSGLRQIAPGIRQDHGADGLVIFDVTRAAAQMTVERLGNRFLEISPRHRLPRQTLEQNLSLVQEARGTVAALEREVLDEGLLQNGQLAVLGMAFHRADRLA